MLHNIPTHVIAGPLGAGKTTLIRHLMAQRPAGERWAVLVNEFGLVGLDAALMATADDGIALAEVAGGCLCCVNGAPFQVGLARLLRKARPDRLFIEPSGLGHPLQLLQQLRQAPWRGVLAVQPLVMVVDAAALAQGQRLAPSQNEAMAGAQCIVMNKSDGLDDARRQWLTAQLQAPVPLLWMSIEGFDLARLPTVELLGEHGVADSPPPTPVTLSSLWINPAEPFCQVHDQPEGWSIGWRWHPQCRLEVERVEAWLKGLAWQRAKLVIHSPQGWCSLNALNTAQLIWRPSEWRNDSRLELIFSRAQDTQKLQEGLRACLC